MANPSVKLKNGGTLLLIPDPERPTRYTVTAQGPVNPAALGAARTVAASYEYGGPADGYPGCRLAWEIAQAVGGEAILPPAPPLPEGAIP